MTQPLARFKYDARNRRIARQDAGGEWTYVISDPAGNPLSEVAVVNGSWSSVRDYVWLDSQPLAQVEQAAGVKNTYYLHADALQTPRAMTNQAGALVWNTMARPYGDISEKTSVDPISGRTVVTNLRLPGQYDERLLGSVGLQGPYYNWNRWYLPSVGRYLELDPIALMGTINGTYAPDWYGYANQNPLRFTDADGTSALADACAKAMEEARARAAQIRAQKDFAEAWGFLDAGHKKKARNAQHGLRYWLDRVKKYCPCPDTPEVREWEGLVNWNPDSVPTSRMNIRDNPWHLPIPDSPLGPMFPGLG
ncbi:RHS repeat domain-containing protein [Anaeromyxobacter terrae]|uniref:RHS repeat domain-containing protein n=1 Tax=Anaeromyxobacter terrae TaxID=2925406 RepID=UPI001F5ACD3C|nr:RHS repeat-associated core domain-containing protein [Anaeromyxobacter sp. SG22]